MTGDLHLKAIRGSGMRSWGHGQRVGTSSDRTGKPVRLSSSGQEASVTGESLSKGRDFQRYCKRGEVQLAPGGATESDPGGGEEKTAPGKVEGAGEG